MASFLLVLFTVAWAAVVFAVLRALVIAWGYERRIAALTGVAVAGAFFVGATSPLALRQTHTEPAPPVAAAAPVQAAAPAAGGVSAPCPAGAKVGTAPGQGHLDTVTVGGNIATANPAQAVEVAAGASFEVGGWTVAAGGPAAAVCVVVDGKPAPFEGRYGLDRPDVAAALSKPQDRASGFTTAVKLAPGTHTVTVGPAEGGVVTPLAGPLTVRVR